MLGKTILNYKIISLIGEGGMGNVYLGEHVSIGRKVAIKVLRPELAGNEEIRKRFMNEAKVMAQLQHPSIVNLIDYHESEDGLFLIMEYVQGKELSELLSGLNQPISIERGKKIMKRILEGFAYAHKNGIVHRDVKPSNILINENDEVKILDFGIAKLVGDSQFNLTKTGTQVGTVYYMSPEQVQAKELDKRSDIYSLGITFYELFSGFCPYKGLKSEFEVYEKIVREDLVPLTKSLGSEYETVWRIIEKASAKNMNDRYNDCNSMIKDIDSVANGALNRPKIPERNIDDSTSKRSSVKGILVALLVLIVVVGIGGAGYYLFTNAGLEDKKDLEKGETSINQDGSLNFVNDFYMIVLDAAGSEVEAQEKIQEYKMADTTGQLKKLGYLWIPDYGSLSGKENFCVFMGPYKTKEEMKTDLNNIYVSSRFWYGKEVKKEKSTQPEIQPDPITSSQISELVILEENRVITDWETMDGYVETDESIYRNNADMFMCYDSQSIENAYLLGKGRNLTIISFDNYEYSVDTKKVNVTFDGMLDVNDFFNPYSGSIKVYDGDKLIFNVDYQFEGCL